jgi:hypothetical protein
MVVLDCACREPQGQLRRLRQQRSRGEMDRGADRAVIDGVASRLLYRRGRGGLGACGGEPADCVPGVARMDVAKRQGDLQRQREQCEVASLILSLL